MLYKGCIVIPSPTSFDHACSPRAVMECHPQVVRLFVLPKGDSGMPRLTSFDRVCFPKAMMACHARRRSTVCAVQRRCCHATPDVVQPCVLPKGGDVMPCPPSSDRVLSYGGDVMPRPTSFDRVCFPKARWHAMPDVVRPCVLSKGGDGMSRLTSFDCVCRPWAIMACPAKHRSIVCAAQRR